MADAISSLNSKLLAWLDGVIAGWVTTWVLLAPC